MQYEALTNLVHGLWILWIYLFKSYISISKYFYEKLGKQQFSLLIPFTSVCGMLFVEKLHSDLIPN